MEMTFQERKRGYLTDLFGEETANKLMNEPSGIKSEVGGKALLSLLGDIVAKVAEGSEDPQAAEKMVEKGGPWPYIADAIKLAERQRPLLDLLDEAREKGMQI